MEFCPVVLNFVKEGIQLYSIIVPLHRPQKLYCVASNNCERMVWFLINFDFIICFPRPEHSHIIPRKCITKAQYPLSLGCGIFEVNIECNWRGGGGPMAPDSKCKSHFHVIAAGFEKLSCCCLGIKAGCTVYLYRQCYSQKYSQARSVCVWRWWWWCWWLCELNVQYIWSIVLSRGRLRSCRRLCFESEWRQS